jgi:colicin import membrane protein
MSARVARHEDGLGVLLGQIALALIIHLALVGLLVLGTMDWQFQKKNSRPALNLDVRVVDSRVLQFSQDQRRAAQEEAKRRAEALERRDRAIAEQQQREQDRQRRQQQEQQQREQAAQVRREAEEQAQRQAAIQRQLDEQREREALIAERERIAAEKRQQEKTLAEQREQERQRQLAQIREERERLEREARDEQQRIAQAEADRRAREEAERLAREQAEAAAAAARAEQIRRDATLREQYIAAIQSVIKRNWFRPATTQVGFRCRINIIQIPGGEVIDATIIGPCNGDSSSQRSVVSAVKRAGDLPYNGFEPVFERELTFTFSYDGE